MSMVFCMKTQALMHSTYERYDDVSPKAGDWLPVQQFFLCNA
jgi:hypothetical protein